MLLQGVGWNFKALPDYVVRMRIVDSDGELRTFSRADDNDMFNAVATNLGLFGVIFDMTFDLFDELTAKAEHVGRIEKRLRQRVQEDQFG